jgi:hypothetical protein
MEELAKDHTCSGRKSNTSHTVGTWWSNEFRYDRHCNQCHQATAWQKIGCRKHLLISDLFQLETSYLRRINDIVIILNVPCINVQDLQLTYTCHFLSLFLNLQAIMTWPLWMNFEWKSFWNRFF